MSRSNDWRDRFNHELLQAEAARAQENEGRARVCARRAAGIAAGEYIRRIGAVEPGPGAYDRLRFLLQLPGVPEPSRAAIEKLLMRVTVEHDLPEHIDLVYEAQRLTEGLLGE